MEQHEEELRSAKHRAAMAPECEVVGEVWARAQEHVGKVYGNLILRCWDHFSLNFFGSPVAFAIFLSLASRHNHCFLMNGT